MEYIDQHIMTKEYTYDMLKELKYDPLKIEWSINEKEMECVISYGDHSWNIFYPLEMLKVDELINDLYREELQSLVKELEQSSRYELAFELPTSYKDKDLIWWMEKNNNGSLLFIFSLILISGIYYLEDRDLQQKVNKRKNTMKEEYASILHKYILYLNAGLTTLSASQKIVHNGNENPIYKELKFVLDDINRGYSEIEAYGRFGKRVGTYEYIKLSNLLMQNIKRGNAIILQQLYIEGDKALQDCLLYKRKKGEEAGTKLLIPMVFMMAIVMVMIILPAFSFVY